MLKIKISRKISQNVWRGINLANSSYEALVSNIIDWNPNFDPQNCCIYYLDDENDQMVVSDDATFSDMLDFFRQTPGRTIKLTLIEKDETGNHGSTASHPTTTRIVNSHSDEDNEGHKRGDALWDGFGSDPCASSSVILSPPSSSSQVPSPPIPTAICTSLERKYLGNPALVASPSLQHQHQERVPLIITGEPTKEKIIRFALHAAVANVGNFYDANNEQFIEEWLGPKFEYLAVNVQPQHKEIIEIIGNMQDLNDRFDRLGIDQEQKLMILCNPFTNKLSHFGHFFDPYCTSTHGFHDLLPNTFSDQQNWTTFGLVRIWNSVTNKLDFTNRKIQNIVISQHHLTNATHVVKSVTYGVAIAAIFHCASGSEEKVYEFKQTIKSLLRNVNNNLMPKQAEQRTITLKSFEKSTQVQIFADPQLQLPSHYIPLSQALDLLRSPPSTKVLPIQYEMVPLFLLLKHSYLNISNRAPRHFYDVNEVDRYVSMARSILSAQDFFEKIQRSINKFSYCFGNKQLGDISLISQRARQEIDLYQKDLSNSLRLYRTYMARPQDLLLSYEECIRQDQEIEELENEHAPLFRKLKMAEYSEQKNVLYIGNGNLDFHRTMQDFPSAYVFLCSDTDQLNITNPSLQLFYRLVEEGEKCIFVDMELADCGPRKGDRVAKYRNGREIIGNYLEEEQRKLHNCIVKILAESRQPHPRPDKLAYFEGPCPKAFKFGGQCPDNDAHWECQECCQLLTFENRVRSFVEFFYCGCEGRVPVEQVLFRCKCNDKHGAEFVHYLPEHLETVLSQLNFGEKNILILGETGVGKSTWINSFANYITYSTLDEAIESDRPVCLIPSQFTIADEKMNTKLIKIGDVDPNERLETGMSATQFAKAHVFPYKGGRIRLIDTPGLIDTGGLEEDEKNFANILTYISNLDEIHGICILLKPNNARLSVIFRYCISELLSNLHRNAAANITFCFTNTRGTLYKPGDTLPSLRLLLEDLEQKQGVKILVNSDTTFCMDNESFRYFCAVHNGIKFDDRDRQNFAESWQKSKSETDRLLRRVNELRPHRTKETVTLNEARRIITAYSQPLALITKTIQDNIARIADERKKLATLNAFEVDFRSKLMVTVSRIKYHVLPQPRTICGSRQCTELKVGPDGQQHILYKQVCHENCHFASNSLENQYPNPYLRWCVIFRESDGQCCSICGCPWYIHMNTRYVQQEEITRMEDPELRKQIEETKDDKAVVQLAIRNCTKIVNMFEDEQKKVNEICAKFAAFLKKNAIMPYNDSIEGFVQLAIREAKRVADETKDFRKVEGLEKFLHIYKEQRRIIDQSVAEGKLAISPEDIKRYSEQLDKLKLVGQNIRELYEIETQTMRENLTNMERNYESIANGKEQQNSCSSLRGTALSLNNGNEQSSDKDVRLSQGTETANSLIGKRTIKPEEGEEIVSRKKTCVRADVSDPRLQRRRIEAQAAQQMPQAPAAEAVDMDAPSAETQESATEVDDCLDNLVIASPEEPADVCQIEGIAQGEGEMELSSDSKESIQLLGPVENADNGQTKQGGPADDAGSNSNAHNNNNETGTAREKSTNATGKTCAGENWRQIMDRMIAQSKPDETFFTYTQFCQKLSIPLLYDLPTLQSPWQALSKNRIDRAYDLILYKKKFSQNSAANAAARALILCGIETPVKNMDNYAEFANRCFSVTISTSKDPSEFTADAFANSTPWKLASFLNEFIGFKTETRVFSYASFGDVSRAITEDIRVEKPVILCVPFSIGQRTTHWHFASVIGVKNNNGLLSESFTLLEVDRSIEYRTFDNLQNWLLADERQLEMEQTNGDQQKDSKFVIIRFQRMN